MMMQQEKSTVLDKIQEGENTLLQIKLALQRIKAAEPQTAATRKQKFHLLRAAASAMKDLVEDRGYLRSLEERTTPTIAQPMATTAAPTSAAPQPTTLAPTPGPIRITEIPEDHNPAHDAEFSDGSLSGHYDGS